MVQITMGNKKRKFRSIKEAADHYGQEYMRFYMRVKHLGWKAATAANKPVRKYVKV